MLKIINLLTLFAFIVLTMGCSTVRTKQTDPIMRVALDSDTISEGSHARLQKALHKNGAWVVVDRSAGFRAITAEQDRQHKTDRFAAPEKYARWGEQFGVGGILIATQQCQPAITWSGRQYFQCLENLSLINATTGEVMAVSESEQETKNVNTAPDWTIAVEELTGNYPEKMVDNDNPNVTVKYKSALKDYRKQNETLYKNFKPVSQEE